MSTNKHTDIDINKLFQEHYIKEIEQIQKTIQNESDRKKIELRTLVGERYRDLIQAADTIAEMKNTSQTVLDEIINIKETFHHMQQKYLIGFKIENDQHDLSQRESSSISDSVVLQIKILMDIPELIWSAIDAKDLLLASELFLIAQHINFSLTFEVGDNDLANKYPIVAKQWGIINQFKSLILNFCNDTLRSIDLSTETAANCLSALVLLNGHTSAELLDKLMSLRNQTIQSIVVTESDLSVKSKIKLCLSILIETIPLVASCFLNHNNNPNGLVSMHINEIKDKDAFRMLVKLDMGEELLNKFLPLLAKNHKPFIQHELQSLALTDIQEKMSAWFDWVKHLTETEVTKLLELITSIKGIYSIREDCLVVDVPENWEFIWEVFSLPSINFWSECFHPLLTKRVKELLNSKLQVCLSNLKKNMSELLNKVSSDSCKTPENDLRWLIWKRDPQDLTVDILRKGLSNNKRPLLMKSMGFSPNVVKVCEDLDNDLAEVLTHLKQYLYEVEPLSSLKDDLLAVDIYLAVNKFYDRNEIQEYLQSISRSIIDDFINFAKEEYTNDEPKFGIQDTNVIVIARLLEAIPLLCTNLKECFTISRSTGITLTNIKWQEICDKLKEENTATWFIWSKNLIKTISQHRSTYLLKETEDDLLWGMIKGEWEKVTIEEEGEEGKKINSEISVPYYPSPYLHEFLSAVIKEINKVLPHTLPKPVLNNVIDSTASELFDYFYKFCTSSELEIRQKQAIQILFDVKYSTLLMVPRENQNLSEQSSKICNCITSKIDPFDFDVFYPFINTNVKRAVQRTLLLYGTLVPHMEQLHSILGARIGHSNNLNTAKDPPSFIAFYKDIPYVPLLPVTKPVEALPPAAVLPSDTTQQRKKQPAKEHTRTDSTGSSIKSSAAAFFGAMSSDWFGGSS